MNEVTCGDSLEVLKTLVDESVDCVITSPPYFGLRDYGMAGQIGLEETPEAYIQNLVDLFREAKRVLKKEGTLWLNLGDSYSSGQRTTTTPQTVRGKRGEKETNARPPVIEWAKQKDLLGIPWRVAFALQADGWYLRQDIIWHKPNPMPESVTDRCTKSHEYIFLLTKSPKYYFDNEAIKEDAVWDLDGNGTQARKERAREGLKSYPEGKRSGIRFGGNKYGDSDDPKHATKSGNEYIVTGKRNRRSVWTVTTKPFKEAHFATFPESLIEPMILAGCPKGGIVLDPFMGAGTTAVVAKKLGRNYLGIELNPEYIKIAQKRIDGTSNPML